MAAISTLMQADAICVTNVNAHTWVEAHSERFEDGTIGIRFLRYMNITDVAAGTFDTMNEAGAWDRTDQDNVT